MDAYEVEVVSDTGAESGVASTIEKQDDGEYLVLKMAGAESLYIRADTIVKINVLTRPCRFSSYDFR